MSDITYMILITGLGITAILMFLSEISNKLSKIIKLMEKNEKVN